MGRPRSDVTDAELAVLKVLWERGAATVREITEELYPAGDASALATVQKLLDRLAAKACVNRRAAGRANVFRASVAREELIAHRLRETAERLCEGSLTPLLTQLVNSKRLSDDDLAELRRLVRDRAATAERGRD